MGSDYLKKDSKVTGWLHPEKNYLVLAIETMRRGIIGYRIESEQDGTPALFEASLFLISDPKVEESWVASYSDRGGGGLQLIPETWSAPGFWEEFFNGNQETVARYEEFVNQVSKRA